MLLAFLCGTEGDIRGRKHSEIMKYDDKMFDECHDFIQWLFPLPVESQHAKMSPVLSYYEVEMGKEFGLFKNLIRKNMIKSTKRFLYFLGFDLKKKFIFNKYYVERSHNFYRQKKYWLNLNNHNHLRINRMLQSLVLFGLGDIAREIFQSLVLVKCEYTDCISEKTMVYWRNALTGYSY